jgi:hypothetical protein
MKAIPKGLSTTFYLLYGLKIASQFHSTPFEISNQTTEWNLGSNEFSVSSELLFLKKAK